MNKQIINDNWQFILKAAVKKGNPLNPNWQCPGTKVVCLPHDYSITKPFNVNSLAQNEGALLDGGSAIYRKKITIKLNPNKLYFLHFDGIIGQALVYFNAKLVAINKNYYTPILADISHLINEGDNFITVIVNNPQPSSRWYSGTGIFRDVHLLTYEKKYLTPANTMANYNEDDNILTISTKLLGEGITNKEKVTLTIINPEDDVALVSTQLTVKEGIASGKIKLPQIIKWEPSNPYLYPIRISLSDAMINEEIIFQYGFRTIEITQKGFFINGQNIKLNGVCLHHDNGALGACEYYSATRRKLLILKEMGVNAIRSTHNMASEILINLCDEMGFFLFDEAFDTWYQGKRKHDYGRFFKRVPFLNNPDKLSYAEWDLKKLIERDRLHPSVFMYSLGNELDETHRPNEETYYWAKRLINICKQYDNTRPYTLGQNGYCFLGEEEAHIVLDKFMQLFPIVGLNYANKQYPELVKRNPKTIYFLSESSSAVRSRGIYIDTNDNYDIDVCNEENRTLRPAFHLNGFPTDRVGWGFTALASQKFVRAHTNMFGEFIWTGFDYLGEPTPWLNNYAFPIKSSYFGIVDLAGFPKDDYYFYRSLWVNYKPTLHICGTLNAEKYDEPYLKKYHHVLNKEKYLLVIYANTPKIKVWHNDNFLGEYIKDPSSLAFKIRFPYAPGIIKVSSYDENDNEQLTKYLKTVGLPKMLNLMQDPAFTFNSQDNLYYVQISATDKRALVYPYADNKIKLTISKNAQILGTDNGNSADLNRLNWSEEKKPTFNLYNGRGLIIIKRCAPGVITLKASTKGLKFAIIKI